MDNSDQIYDEYMESIHDFMDFAEWVWACYIVDLHEEHPEVLPHAKERFCKKLPEAVITEHESKYGRSLNLVNDGKEYYLK